MNPIQLNRKDGESLFEWKLRLITAKLDREIDLDWVEICELLELNCSGDHLRKTAYGIREAKEYYESKIVEGIQDEDVIGELEMKKIELLEERKKLQAVRSEYNKIAREKARKDLLFEYVKESFEKLEAPEPLIRRNNLLTEKAYVLSFGDIHFGKKFKSIHNEYSEEIAMERMNEIIADTVKYIEMNNITHLHVINGADSIEGLTLRTSQLQSLQSGFVDQVIKFSKFYAKWLNELSRYVKLTVHHLTSSNHTEIRPFNSGRGEYPTEDMERIIGMYIQDILEGNERIDVKLYENGFADFEVLGYNVCALHGHQLKSNKNAIKDLSHLHRKFYDFCFVAHFHHGNNLTVGVGETNNIKVIQIPSVMGSDRYSDSLMTGAKAGALITTFTKGKGQTDTHEIILN